MSVTALQISASDVTQLQAESVIEAEFGAVYAPVKPIVPRSNQTAFRKVVAALLERINNAKSVIAFPIAGVL